MSSCSMGLRTVKTTLPAETFSTKVKVHLVNCEHQNSSYRSDVDELHRSQSSLVTMMFRAMGQILVNIVAEIRTLRTLLLLLCSPVSTPVIINERGKRSVISTESSFLLCSVENGEDVKLSWYRENERISITNNTDLSVPLNLSLQIQHNDTNTYICVSANPVSNKTTSLNITQLCDVSDDHPSSLLPALISAGLFVLLIIILIIWGIRLKNKEKKVTETPGEVTYTDIKAHSAERDKEEENSTVTDAEVERDPVVYSDDEHRLVTEGYLVPRPAWSADSLQPIKAPTTSSCFSFFAQLLCLCYSFADN
ncbi:uncharacterized protein LOC113649943 isoform X5 [Tachysurus fulvidraco]|uniref:uncharacterized protein LOC113649943 isoform X5 n=2 Tax=Tachysurus fulvidraco TaxID=1234273 RepID=UPI001FEFF1C6|nr:uncharacterized protein LOC113649943 isoform X5 [Tachysurus fulvidraco]